VVEADDDTAILRMVESNLHRPVILPSEKAFSYKMQLAALKRKAGRPSINSAQVGPNLSGEFSREILSNMTGESGNQIRRYIRLTELLPQLLDMMDNKKLPFNPAVELSYLKPAEQEDLLLEMEDLNCVPTLEQSKKLKELSSREDLKIEQIEAILTQVRENENSFTIKRQEIRDYIPEGFPMAKLQRLILELLAEYQKKGGFAS
jgi:ParB family chromosome partitioning protein